MKFKKIELLVELPDGIKDYEVLQKFLSAITSMSFKSIVIKEFKVVEHNPFALDIDRQEFDDMKKKIDKIYENIE